MGKNHWPPIKPHKPVNPNPVNPNPPAPGVPLIWWAEKADDRLVESVLVKDNMVTPAEAANVGIATLIIQRDDGSLWRVKEDKAPYTWVQVNTPGDGKAGDPYKTIDWTQVPETGIEPWTRVVVTTESAQTFKINTTGQGDSFEIVDVERLFAAYPVTLIPPQHFNFPIINIAEAQLVLDTLGEGSTWRFLIIEGDIVVENVP